MRNLLVVIAVLGVTACDSTVGPPPGGNGLSFDVGGARYAAVGTPASAGSVLQAGFAVARADSLNGFTLIGFESGAQGKGNLFVLQALRQTGTMTCASSLKATPCHGRYIAGLRDGQPMSYDKFYDIVAGSITVTTLGPERVKGTFSATLQSVDGRDQISISNGTIDVPYHTTAAAGLRCLMELSAAATQCR